MLLHAAALGCRVIEVPIAPIHFEDRCSRFRPGRDGLAVGAFLAGRIVTRWAREAAAGALYLIGIFSPSRLRARHREMYAFAAPHRSNPAGWALAVGTFIADRAIRSVEDGWRSPHARALRLAGLATAATPLMLALALARRALASFGVDWLTPAARGLYRQEELAAALDAPARRVTLAGRPADYDVLVVGGGPGGSSAATFLSRGGLRVAVAEREAFPRFHVGESLLPANLPVLERLGVLDEVKAHGFFVKYGAYFHDQEMDLDYQFFFREGKPWPPYTYEVQRGEFDKILLDHAARQPNVTLLQPATVERVAFDDDGGDRDSRRGRGLARDPRPLSGGRERARRVHRLPTRPAAAHRGAGQGGALRPLPRREALAGTRRRQYPHLHLRGGLVLVHPVRQRYQQRGLRAPRAHGARPRG